MSEIIINMAKVILGVTKETDKLTFTFVTDGIKSMA